MILDGLWTVVQNGAEFVRRLAFYVQSELSVSQQVFSDPPPAPVPPPQDSQVILAGQLFP